MTSESSNNNNNNDNDNNDVMSISNNNNSSNSQTSVASKPSHSKRVKFDERCRVRRIRKHQYFDPEVKEQLWYNREELKAIRKDCKGIMKEALHQLQRAQQEHKKKNQAKDAPPRPQPQSGDKIKKNKAKHLFPPSSFRGLEMFHPKMSFKREGRRQDQWESILTVQAQQDMAHTTCGTSSTANNGSDLDSDNDSEDAPPKEKLHKRLPKDDDLLKLAEISLTATQVAVKEAHKRALRDEQDLLHPPQCWMLPWLIPQEQDGEEREDVVPKTGEVTAVVPVSPIKAPPPSPIAVVAITKKIKGTKLEKLLRKSQQLESSSSSPRSKSRASVNASALLQSNVRTMT
ncbi:MAG: hypothetical protein SGBAC_013365 [Bacillariaceae sp.]